MVGWSAILIGLTGVVLHLDSAFFYERTIRSLTYSAPFAAPLAYTGRGFLLVLNRLEEPNSEEWARWVLFMALGGFIGNFIFSLTDHAGNGFFERLEWVPVGASAIAVGFLATPSCYACRKSSGAVRRRVAFGSWSRNLGLRLARSTKSGRTVYPCLRQFHLWRTTFGPPFVPESCGAGIARALATQAHSAHLTL